MKKAIFKEDDKVKILGEIVSGKQYGCFACDFRRAKCALLGKKVTIKKVCHDRNGDVYYSIKEDEKWLWSEEMFEIGDIQQIIE